MIVGLLAMLFMIITAYITLARFDRISLQKANAGAKAEEIVNSVNEVIAGRIANSFTGEDGQLNFGGKNFSDIPGYGGTRWLAARTPVRVSGSSNKPDVGDFEFPATTDCGIPQNMTDMLFDRPDAGDDSSDTTVDVDPYNWNNQDDTAYNALHCFMDANGDGIVDAYFGSGDPNDPNGVWMFTELANAIGGVSVRAAGVNPSSVAQNGDSQIAWQMLDNRAKYLSAVQVISHGGMVTMGLPTVGNNYEYWAGEFAERMFAWVADATEITRVPDAGDRIWRDVWDQQAAIEPLLRLRGGLLVGSQGHDAALMPDALEELVDTKGYALDSTLIPHYNKSLKADNWQRFNLASGDEWQAWVQAMTVDADDFNNRYYNSTGTPQAAREGYVPRQDLTADNTSDELARDSGIRSASGVAFDRPSYDGPAPNALELKRPGIFPGTPKYFLGRIAFAFDGSGNFKYEPTDPNYNGYHVLRDLTNYYTELLSSYDEWGGSDEAVSLDDQARMLAVNTVAFAAPWNNTDKSVDTVYCYNSNTTKAYFGYVPQLFITQVLAYNDPWDGDPNDFDPNDFDPNDPNVTNARLALAVELYNPHDRALSLDSFGVSVAGLDRHEFQNVAQTIRTVPPRSFVVVGLRDTNNAYFESHNTSIPGWWAPMPAESTSIPYDEATPIVVQLWRRGIGSSTWYVVDRLGVEPGRESGGGALQSFPSDEEWWMNVQRDTGSEQYLGKLSSGEYARWRMVVADLDLYSVGTGKKAGSVLGELAGLGVPPDSVGGTVSGRTGPCTPFPVMNAGLAPVLVNGAYRPASFPTVGFMHFIPRFAHTATVANGVATGFTPMGETLYEQWTKRGGGTIAHQLADFGHMPLFDNRQDVDSESDFSDSEIGHVPWGLLVYDYFTTLNPDDADGDRYPYWNGDQWVGTNSVNPIDIYRVAGRIDINNAPWYVLAGLPVIGPTSNDATAALPLSTLASPEFWDPDSGYLAGEGGDNSDKTQRFIGAGIASSSGYRLLYNNGWWRLGPFLAQAAASYRDRVQYGAGTLPAGFNQAATRNAISAYRPATYGGIRGLGTSGASKMVRGFLTVGELANVVGFDSAQAGEVGASNANDPLVIGDFFRSISLLALLDTHYLTTRSNVFTVYSTLAVNDPEDTQASVRSQVTLDRSNTLPHIVLWNADYANLDGYSAFTPQLQWIDLDDDGQRDTGEWQPIMLTNPGMPEVVGKRESAYTNARYEN